MSFIKSILGIDKPVLGVDIGTASIKLAEIGKIDGKITLKNYGILSTEGYLTRFNEAFQTSSLKLSLEGAASYIKFLIKKSNIAAKTVIASVPSFLSFSTLVEVPQMSNSELKKFVANQAAQYIPMPLELVTMDWIKVGERKDETGSLKDQLLLISIPNEQVEVYKKIFEHAGLKLESVELEGMSSARALSLKIKEPSIIIDIGSRSTSFSVVQSGFLKFSGQTDFSGGSLTKSISNGLNINQKRAEDLKKQRGLSGFGGEHELSTLMQPMLDVIINEAKRVVFNYEKNYGEKVESVILSGGGANLIGIEEYLNKNFGLPTKKADSFSEISYPEILKPIARDTGPLLSVAIGLGMKNFI